MAHTYNIVFETGGQLVKGNQVLVGGQPFGTIDDISLTDDGQADVKVTVDEPCTRAPRRSFAPPLCRAWPTATSRSSRVRTTRRSSGRCDAHDGQDHRAGGPRPALQHIRRKTRRGLSNVIQGWAPPTPATTKQANETYKYFAPGLQATDRLLRELIRDQQTFSEFLVSGSRTVGALAERRDDLSALTSNANQALGAIAQENVSLDRSLAALPPALRQANTTFVNLRAALDDLTPLILTAKTATKDLPEFLRDLRPVANEAVPVIRNLRVAIATPGPHNDLTDVLARRRRCRSANGASEAAGRRWGRTQDEVTSLRAYTPDLIGFLTKFGQVNVVLRRQRPLRPHPAVATGAFQYNAARGARPARRDPGPVRLTHDAGRQVEHRLQRCPGAASQAAGRSAPFLDPPIAGGPRASKVRPGR